MLVRGDDHDHLASFHGRLLFDLPEFLEILLDPLQELETKFAMRMLATAKPHGHLDLVALLEKLDQVAHLDLVVADIRGRTKLDFLDLNLLLFFPGGLLLFLLLEDMFAVVHDAANRWFCIRDDLDEILSCSLRCPQRIFNGNDSDLFTVCPDQSDFDCRDAVIETVTLVLFGDSNFSASKNNKKAPGIRCFQS